MDNPFDSVDALEGEGDEHMTDNPNPFDAAGDEGFEGDGFVDEGDGADMEGADAYQEESADSLDADGVDDMALWNAFEEEIADGLDAADEDEFLGRLLGGLGRAGGALRRVAGGARRVGQIAGQAGQLARRASPAAAAAARMARLLGAPGLASGLNTVARGAMHAGRFARNASSLAGGVGRVAGGAAQALGGLGQAGAGLGQAAGGGQALMAQLAQLFGGGGNEFDDFESLADSFEDGVDEALPGLVGLAARAAARGVGFNNVAQLGQAGRRALVRGVAAAARELVNGRDPANVRALPRLAHAAGRAAARVNNTPQAAAQNIRRGLPRTARNVARNPQVLRRVARPRSTGGAQRGPISRPNTLGRGTPTISGPRTFRIDGPISLTITPR